MECVVTEISISPVLQVRRLEADSSNMASVLQALEADAAMLRQLASGYRDGQSLTAF